MALMGAIKSVKDPVQGPKSKRPLPTPAERAMQALGENINLARRRRGMTQQAVADRAGVSLNTVKRLEAGDARMQLHVIARVLHLFGEIDQLSHLLDTSEDDVGLTLADEQLPKRIRPRRSSENAF